ncbi:MAG: hypothetical protein OXF98_01830 [Rhodospirillaceae bacterium]|nr:hypothetical protein [Rhodospirillaceae bacterium]
MGRIVSPTEAELRRLAELALNDRIAEVLIAIKHRWDPTGNEPTKHATPLVHGDTIRYDHLYAQLGPIVTSQVLVHLGLRDWGHPYLDQLSGVDLAEVIAAINKLPDKAGEAWTANLNKIKAAIPAPLVKFTGLVDLVDLGGDEPRLLQNRPRTFSAAALKGVVIPAEPARYKADDNRHVLRIDWIENTGKKILISSSPKGEQKQITTITLDKANKYVKLYGKDLHEQTWTVTVVDIPKPKDPPAEQE